ncbi:MAG: GNAT family N-acetyltransferase [Candidatus Cloacimonetes bacterium]|nr:GNAT family N-acetyltransferase [Candidatus Cloacimonadota bacterium]
MKYREITISDIPVLIELRTKTDENDLSLEVLLSLGINEKTFAEKLSTTYKGWLCEIAGNVVAFAIGDKQTGEMWVIAVLPEYIKQGIGGKLLTLVEEWLFTQGCQRIWLTTDIDTKLRAYSFYLNHSWLDDRIEDGMRYMIKDRPDNKSLS